MRSTGSDHPAVLACAESFRSHLINRTSRPRCGCTRETPCAHCRLILAGFTGMRPEDIFDRFDANKQQRLAYKTLGTKPSATPLAAAAAAAKAALPSATHGSVLQL